MKTSVLYLAVIFIGMKFISFGLSTLLFPHIPVSVSIIDGETIMTVGTIWLAYLFYKNKQQLIRDKRL